MIHVAPGLSSKGYGRAVDLGPSEVCAKEDPARLHQLAGFAAVEQVDTTDLWLATTSSFMRARQRHEEGLRQAEGDEAYEEEQTKKRGLVEGTTADPTPLSRPGEKSLTVTSGRRPIGGPAREASGAQPAPNQRSSRSASKVCFSCACASETSRSWIRGSGAAKKSPSISVALVFPISMKQNP